MVVSSPIDKSYTGDRHKSHKCIRDMYMQLFYSFVNLYIQNNCIIYIHSKQKI
jgi:hypothetical protein